MSIISYNEKVDKIKKEKPLPVDFEKIQKLLKINGKHDYSITAFDFSKIERIYYVSTNFVHRLLYIDTKIVNRKNMRDLSILMDDLDIKGKLDNLIEEFELIKEDIDEKDEKIYYQKLRNFEKRYKLYDN